MTTKEKTESIKKFLNKPENKLIWNKTRKGINAGKFFNIELSKEPLITDFSTSVSSENIDEAKSILNNITINKSLDEVENDLKKRLKESNIDINSKFYITIKGNIDSRVSDKFDIEKELMSKGFNLDFEKDERSTYIKEALTVTLFWSGDLIDENGRCNSMNIQSLYEDEPSYFGVRPINKNEFENLCNKYGLN